MDPHLFQLRLGCLGHDGYSVHTGWGTWIWAVAQAQVEVAIQTGGKDCKDEALGEGTWRAPARARLAREGFRLGPTGGCFRYIPTSPSIRSSQSSRPCLSDHETPFCFTSRLSYDTNYIQLK